MGTEINIRLDTLGGVTNVTYDIFPQAFLIVVPAQIDYQSAMVYWYRVFCMPVVDSLGTEVGGVPHSNTDVVFLFFTEIFLVLTFYQSCKLFLNRNPFLTVIPDRMKI